MISKLHKWFIGAIVFLNGYQFMLPLNIDDDLNKVYVRLPSWATSFEVVHGIHTADFLFIVYFLIFGFRQLKKITKFQQPLWFAYGLTALSFIGIVSTIVNFEIFSDYFESIKLIMLAYFLLFIFFWSNALGPLFILRVFMIGLSVSSLVNLYFTFSNPVRLLGGLPMLLGQNGPGGSAGFLMFLSAWLSVLSSKKIDKLLIILFILINVFLLMISYSKLGAMMGALGILGFIFIQFRGSILKMVKERLIPLFVIISLFLFWLLASSTGEEIRNAATTIYVHKLGEGGSNAFDSGDKERLYYYFAVWEIFTSNPLFGVGYNGFLAAIESTDAHSSGEMSEEDSEVNANPHNAFLYYISANGILGWVVVIFLFGQFLITFFQVFKSYGLAGLFTFCFIGVAAIIHTNSLIGFFNTTMMYVPLGVAYALNYQRHKGFKSIILR
jgi:O-antigen ligase